MHIVNIVWEKITYDQDVIRKFSSVTDYGIYQIYGKHPAYGNDALIYIGQASRQTFSTRLFERWEFVESCASPHSIRIGRLVKSSQQMDLLEWDEDRKIHMIELCERLLLHSHAPAFNKQNNCGLYDINTKENNIHIFNWGDFGDLLPEVSSYRYSFKYWKYETPIAY